MRYIVMHKLDPDLEAGGPPDQDIIQNMGALVQESIRSGIFKNGAGLHPSALRARVNCTAGECTVTRGPYQAIASWSLRWPWSKPSRSKW